KIGVLDAVLLEVQDVATKMTGRPDDAWPVVVTGVEQVLEKGVFAIHVELRPSAAKAGVLAAMSAAQREKIVLRVARELGTLLGLDPMPGYGRPLGAIQMTPLRSAVGWTEDDKARLRAEIARRAVLLLSWSHDRGKCLAVRNAEGEFSYAEKSAEAPR
ncbi:MAG: hypothetical protein KJ579_00030, partial [Verrucomicrobia bacterium]|nr:hypothetical protein [Verrucomicrobiota bacterium]